MIFYPERLALLGIFVYAAIYIVAPLDSSSSVYAGALVYIGACYLCFFLGCALSSVVMSSQRPIAITFRGRSFWIIFVLGAVGMMLRVYDKYISRGASFGSGAMEIRQVLADSSAGPLAALAGVLFPFCYIPLIMLWTRGGSRLKNSKFLKVMAAALFVLPSLDALLLYSRSQMIVGLGIMFFVVSIVFFRGRVFARPLILYLALFGVGLLTVSTIVFSARLMEMNFELNYSIFRSAYGYFLKPNSWANETLGGDPGLLREFVGAIVPATQYYLHGLFEFMFLWDNGSSQVFSYGALAFGPYVKALSILGLATQPNLFELFPRVGVFTTFFGPLWVDFGWVGTVVMGGFGFLCKFIARCVMRGDTAAYPIYGFLCVVIFFMPVVNFLVSAQGMYVLNAFLLYWVMSRASFMSVRLSAKLRRGARAVSPI